MFTKVYIKKVYFFLALIFASHITAGRLDLEAAIREIAENQGLGYKGANLNKLTEIIENFNTTHRAYKLAVPAYQVISSDEIISFLKQTRALPKRRRLNGFDLQAGWEQIISRNFYPGTSSQTDALRTGTFDKYFLFYCDKFRQDLAQSFNQIIENIDDIPELDVLFGYKKLPSLGEAKGENRIEKFLSHLDSTKERLMVRSSGKEDTPDLANAGGNESIANVMPTKKDILVAVRDVVISYFSDKSLKQRLAAKDESLFTGKILVPVILQRMIGEKANIIPKCGVMFTEEPEGGISRYHDEKDKDGRINTSGITVIQAAYGHNEAVVNSLIPVDTFYLNRSKIIYPVIRVKTHRMAPLQQLEISLAGQEKKRLAMVKNDDKLARRPALNKEAVLMLKDFADVVEDFYGRPMDIEYVINEEEKIIYIVQARPIVHRKDIPQASYIVDPQNLPVKDRFIGQSVVVAGGSLRIVRNASDIIIAPNINDALAIYNDNNKVSDKEKIRAIIIGKPAPRTSHEATQFRGENKPVIYMEKWTELRDIFQNIKLPMLISPQQNSVFIWQDKLLTDVSSLIEQKIASLGWSDYPIDGFVSVHKDFTPSLDRARWRKIPSPLKAQLSQRLASIKNDQLPASLSSLDAISMYAISHLDAKMEGLTLDKETGHMIRRFKIYLLSYAYSIIKTLDYEPTDQFSYPNRLFAIRFLENLLLQQPRYDEIVDGLSLVRWSAILDKEKSFVEKLTAQGITLDRRALQYLHLSAFALTDELKNQWENFVTNFSQKFHRESPERLKFEEIILKLGDLEILPLWLNTSFSLASSESGGDDANLFSSLTNEFDIASPFIGTLYEYQKKMNAFNESNAFEKQEDFAKRWQEFNNNLLEFFLSDNFLQKFNGTNNMGKLVALSTMRKLVDKFDLSIKAITGNGNYTTEIRVGNFHTMLKTYAELFKRWTKSLVPEGAIRYSKRSPLDHYIKFIDEVLAKKGDNFDLLSSGYNAGAFTIGNAIDFVGSRISRPSTFEDIFTMVHQCLLTTLNTLSALSGVQKIKLPIFLADTKNQLLKMKSNIEKPAVPVLIGIDFDQNSIIQYYNLPLRDHSIQFELVYDVKKQETSLLVKFFGDNFHNRWGTIAHVAFLAGLGNVFNIKDINFSRDALRLHFNIDPKFDNEKQWEKIQNLVFYSNIHADYNKKLLADFGDIIKSVAQTQKDLKQKLDEKFGPEGSIHSDIKKFISDLISSSGAF